MNINIDDSLRFEWDENKNRLNRKKHSISFEEAATIFLDEDGLLIPDPDHSDIEERFILIGTSRKADLLTVVHCLRESETVIRIISARRATRNESNQYYSKKGEQNEKRI